MELAVQYTTVSIFEASMNLTNFSIFLLNTQFQVFPEYPSLVNSIVQSDPRILRKNVDNFLKPTIVFLQELYGIELFYEAVTRNPSILLSRGVGYDSSTEEVKAIEDFLMSSLGLKQSALAKLKKKSPWLFQRSVDQIGDVIEFWDGILRDGGEAPKKRKLSLQKC